MLSLKNITKQYGLYKANNDISLEIPSHEIFGMLGPNGAGKTTLIRIITGITMPDSGSILFEGKKYTLEDRLKIGYMPEERGLYKKMKVGEQLIYLAQLKGLSKAEALKKIKVWVDKFEIASWWNKHIEELSKGMQQKIQFISTVVHEPKLIILDEPFSGLDPINADLIIHEMQELKNNGATIIFSTHRMEQVEELCKSIVLINKGQNILEGNVSQLRKQYKEKKYEIVFENQAPIELLKSFDICSQEENNVVIQLKETENARDILQHLVNNHMEISSFKELLPTLHEIFVKRVKESENVKPINL
ncbi:MAG: ATP-binding cassette domain-containing protein [Bacteroidota bacterium]